MHISNSLREQPSSEAVLAAASITQSLNRAPTQRPIHPPKTTHTPTQPLTHLLLQKQKSSATLHGNNHLHDTDAKTTAVITNTRKRTRAHAHIHTHTYSQRHTKHIREPCCPLQLQWHQKQLGEAVQEIRKNQCCRHHRLLSTLVIANLIANKKHSVEILRGNFSPRGFFMTDEYQNCQKKTERKEQLCMNQ